MSVQMTMPVAEFQKNLDLCFQHSSRTFPQFVNGQGLRLASFAVDSTKRADANKIAWALGQTDRRFYAKKTGALLKTPRRVFSNSAASINLYRIVNWRRARAGLPALGGQAMSGPARRLRAAALRSSGYIASGWLYAVKALSKLAGYGDRVPYGKAARMTGAAKGYAKPASFTLSGMVTCEIANTALIALSAPRTGSRPGSPMAIAERGLAVARDRTAKDMLKHLAEKLMPVFSRFSAVPAGAWR